MNGVINGTLTKRKINLLSAHDLTVAAMLKALDIFDNKSPVFTSGVIVELHETDGDYFVKVSVKKTTQTFQKRRRNRLVTSICNYSHFLAINTN